MRRFKTYIFIALTVLPLAVSAHEQYVLSPEDLLTAKSSPLTFWGILTPERLPFLFTATGLAAAGFFGLLFLEKRVGHKLNILIERYQDTAIWLLRLGTAAVLVIGGSLGSFLGPDIILPLPLSFAAIVAGLFLAIMPHLGAGLGSLLYLYCLLKDPGAAMNYLHYPAIFLLFILPKEKRPGWIPDLVRIAYGLALLYAALAMKFLHPGTTLAIVEKFNLMQFHWLFPSDPYLILAGAALTEMAIGIFLIAGILVRPMIAISLFYATLALLYLPEPLWPHLILYFLSFYILAAPQRWKLDDLLSKQKTP